MTGHKLEVIVLAEKTVRAAGLLGEHGLAFLMKADNRSVLFDTGQGKVLPENARRVGVRLGKIEAVVISHGHFDHTGGLHTALGRFKVQHHHSRTLYRSCCHRAFLGPLPLAG